MTLLEAIEAYDADALKKAIKSTTDINEDYGQGRTALIEAARRGYAMMVRTLLEAGAEPSIKDAEDETALLKAAANGHHAVVQVLAPLANEDERDMARAFLKACGKTHAPELQEPEDFAGIKRAAAVATARVSKFVGHDDPAERLARVDRADANAGKKKQS